MITKETRAESHSKVNKTLRYAQIRIILKKVYPGGLTSRQLSKELGSEDRNYTAPRCTELHKKGELEVIGKRYDANTNRYLSIYRLVKKEVI